MTLTTRTEYLELISALKKNLLEEHPKGEWLTVDADTFSYFKQKALQTKAATAPAPALRPTTPSQAPTAPPQPLAPTPIQVKAPVMSLSIPAPTENHKVPDPVKATPMAPQTPPAPATATAKPTSTQKAPDGKKAFVREPLPAPTAIDFSEMQKYFAEKLPLLPLEDCIPPDHEAKEIANRWKAALVAPEVIILSFNETAREKEMLNNLAAALSRTIAPSTVVQALNIEQEKSWNKVLQNEKLRLVIASNYSIYTLQELMNHYREDSQAGKHFLGRIRLHLLPDLSLYIQEPRLKAPLWRTLTDILTPR